MVPDAHEFYALAELYLRTNGPNWQIKQGWLNGCTGNDFATWYGIQVADGDVVGITLYDNDLTGPLANSLGRLKQLKKLRLKSNALNGSIPDSLLALPELEILDLSGNHLGGKVPDRFSTRSGLRTLDLSSNMLGGEVPASLFNLSSLERTNLSNNQLSGSLPLSFARCGSLRSLQVSSNNLTGELPASGYSVSDLDTLDLTRNRFSGAIPAAFASLPRVRVLKLGYNRFRFCPVLALPARPDKVDISGNALDFGSLEPNFTSTGPITPLDGIGHFLYGSQNITGDPVELVQPANEPIVLEVAMGGQMNQYRWQIAYGNGSWQSIGNNSPRYVSSYAAGRYKFRCKITNAWVQNVELYSPETTIILTPAPNPPPAITDPSENDRWNWTLERTFDGSGATTATSTVTGEGKQYTDGFGRPSQTQSRSQSSGHVLAAQTILSAGGQPALQTLAAPISNSAFKYADLFVRPATNPAVEYSFDNFEDRVTIDAVASNIPGTLGNYYSTLNQQEPLTPATSFPFSLTEAYDGPTGGLKRSMGPGDANYFGSDHEKRFGEVPILNELDVYAQNRSRFGSRLFNGISPGGLPPVAGGTFRLRGTKSVSIDPDGVEKITFTSQDGQTLATCLSGDASYQPLSITFSLSATNPSSFSPAYLDIHVPAGGASTLLMNRMGSTQLTQPCSVKIINLSTNVERVESVASGNGTASFSLDPGFYRFVSLEGDQSFSYNVRYGNFNYSYYNDAGRLIATVAPKGDPSGSVMDYTSWYDYTSTGSLLCVWNADEGRTDYVYRADGILRFSRSSLQSEDKGNGLREFSYSNYDSLGRVVESGVYETQDNAPGRLAFALHTSTNQIGGTVLEEAILEDRTRSGGLDHAYCREINGVWYDFPDDSLQNLAGRTQQFVLGAVAKTHKAGFTSWYSYDDQGRLTWLVQRGPLGFKTVDYSYDVSGNVREVAYQRNQPDAYYHYYTYDCDQRLSAVYASPDGVNRTQLARYSYYLHGPLKRAELANRLQGVDYVYTINGWLKAINAHRPDLDPGGDRPDQNGVIADFFSLRLDYFAGDYRSFTEQTAQPTIFTGTTANRADSFDGSLRAASWRTANSSSVQAAAYNYSLRGEFAGSYTGTVPSTPPRLFTPSDAVGTGVWNTERHLSYDPNGNLTRLYRYGESNAPTDRFAYRYYNGNNKLRALLDERTTPPSERANYEYDATGQLIHESFDGAERYLTYDAAGKVTGIYRDAEHQDPIATYTYDDRGFRATQTVKRKVSLVGEPEPGDGELPSERDRDDLYQTVTITTHYVRDVSGNVLSVYETTDEASARLIEVPLYAASRVGTLTRVDDEADGNDSPFDARYELTDHLGNARVIFHQPRNRTARASLEPANYAEEESEFQNLPATRSYQPSLARTGQHVARIPANSPPMTGPLRELLVNKGDSIIFTAWAYVPAPGTVLAKTALLLGGQPAAGLLEQAVDAATATQPEPAKQPRVGVARLLSRLSVGLGINLFGHQQLVDPGPVLYNGSEINGVKVFLDVALYDENNQVVDRASVRITDYALGGWYRYQVPFKATQGGRVEAAILSAGTGRDVLFDDLSVRSRDGYVVQEQHFYPYGAPITGLSYAIGTHRYRHGYQGKYAENDTTTGYNSFELRLYDARIGRWFAPDPYGQYVSPYVGMGNNPVTGVDPDGGMVPDPTKPIRYLGGFNWTAHYGSTAAKAAGAAGSAARMGNGVRIGLQAASLLGTTGRAFGLVNSPTRTFTVGPASPRPQISSQEQLSLVGNGTNWLGIAGGSIELRSGFGGSTSQSFDYAASQVRLGTNWKLYFLKESGKPFYGNSSVSTFKLAPVLKTFGIATFAVGTFLDVHGVRNYYRYGSEAANVVHPAQAGTNFAVGLWALQVGGVGGFFGGLGYFGISSYYPGGWPAALDYLGTLNARERASTGRAFLQPPLY